MTDELPVVVQITDITVETPVIRTLHLSGGFPSVPGQFVMVWIPGIDEIPMALSGERTITVQQVGDATAALCSMPVGAQIGIRGPYGNGFPDMGNVLAIAGGVGAAPLLPLALSHRVTTFLLGARTVSELPFSRTLHTLCELRIATDDGSIGHHGPVTGLLEGVRLGDYDAICVCGPERMMHAVLVLLNQAGIADRGYFSLHRYMKCGLGVCGSCCIDPAGLQVCRDGPVFRGDVLIGSEFGRYKRDASGRRVPV